MIWSELTDSQRDDLLKRYYEDGEKIESLAVVVGIRPMTLERRLRDWRNQRGAKKPQVSAREFIKKVEVSTPKEPGIPAPEDLFSYIKAAPRSLDEMAEHFDRSKTTVRGWVASLQDAGYVISEERDVVSFDGKVKPNTENVLKDLPTLADQEGQVISFAACSDLHAGSAFSQPTNRKKFLDIAYYEYGVRHVFDPGDKTTGVGGYRGQEHDMLPASRLYGSRNPSAITKQQIWLADQYTPKYPGLKYYILGGNHDYWHVVNSGIDAVAALAKSRDDMVYLGYDVADVPLTDRVDVRLWHPSGGVPYSLSYRLQKALEQTAFEELTRAVTESENPRLRLLLAGHLHVEVKFSRGPMVAAHVGCFEGQTNYLKRKGLFPQIGGSIFRVWVSDSGLIQRTEYTFIPFNEIQNDWANWPTPETPSTVLHDPEDVGVIFRVNDPGEVFYDQRAA